MFDTCEWNDNVEAQTLVKSLVTTQKKTPAAQEKSATSRRKRLKRNQELLEVLRTLTLPSARNPELQPPPNLPAPSKSHPLGKQKKTAPDVSTNKSPTTDTPNTEAPPLGTANRLSRQQWKNKVKNKRKNRNKFKLNREEGGTTNGGVEKARRGPQGGQTTDQGGKAKRSKTDRDEPENGSGRNVKRRRLLEEEIGDDLPGSADTAGGQKKGGRKKTQGEAEEGSESGHPRKKVQMKKRPGAAEEMGDRIPGKRKDERTPDRDQVTANVTPLERARLQKLKKLLQREGAGRIKAAPAAEKPEESATIPDPPVEEEPDRSASLRSRMEQRLTSARFRYINEQLYTSDSQEAVSLFQSDPEAFSIYHTGFSQQVQRWPVNPITEILKYIRNRPRSLVVADFGCGDAQLARSVRNIVHSFDLVALNDRVTVCDMAEVPLSDATVDIAVFCLSLMGKNLSDFLQEANRVLKSGGVLLVAEVSSRFDDTRQFLSAMSQLGFKSVNKNTDNSYFYLFEFSKVGSGRDASKHPGLQLKPCLYKKR